MQDKIKEISELIDVYAGILAEMEIENRYDTDMHHNCSDAWFNIESKLRELVREPLPYEQAWSIAATSDSALDAIRKAERAHGITKEGGE